MSRSYTVKFGADTSGFKSGTGDMIKQLNELNKALVDNKYRQKDCNKAISEAQKEIKNLEKKQKEKGKLDADEEKKLEELNATIEQEKLKLSQLRTEQSKLNATIKKTSREIVDNNKQWTTLKATMANLASEGVQFLAAKLLNLGKTVITIGEDFTSSMSEVGAISGASAEQLELLEQTAREYGATTRFSASEAAQALKYMALAGWDANQSVESLGSVLDLAAAGNMDLAKASDIVTDYLTAFGLSAQDSAHFSDVMAYAMSNSNTNVEQLGDAYKNCAATAASMNFSLEEVTAALMTMANAGVKGGEAGTTLNTLMTRLATNAKGCGDELDKYGVHIYDSQGKMKSLSDIMNGLIGVWSGLTQEQQANLSKMIAGTNQYSGFQTLMQGMSEKAKAAGASFQDYSKALEECDGTSKDMAKTMSDNLSGDLKTMQSAFEELALEIYKSGETPLRNIVQFITSNVVPAIGTVIDNLDKILPVVIAVTSAITSYKAALAISGVVEKLTNATKALTVATEGAKAAQEGLNIAQEANVMGLAIAGLSAFISGLISYNAIAGASKKSTEQLNEAMEQANSVYASTLSQVEAESKTIETLGQRYEELRKQTKLSADEQTELKNVAEQLKTKMKLTDEQIQSSDGSYKSLTKSIQETTKAMRAQAEIEALSAGYKAAYAKQTEAQLEYEKKLEEVRKKYPELYDAKGNLNQKAYNYDTSEAVREVESLKKAYSDAGETAKRYSDKMAKATKETASLGNQTDKTSNSVDDAADKISDHTSEIKKYAEALSAGADGYSVEGLQKLFGDSIKEFLSLASDLTTTISTLSSTYEKLNEGKALDLSATLDLCTKYPEYAGALLEATGNAKKQKEIIKQLFEAKKQDLVLTLTKARDEIKADNEVTKNTLENAKKRLKAMQNTFYRKEDINKALKEYSELQKMINELNKSYESGAEKVKNYNTQIKNISDININSFATDKSDSSPTSKSSGSSNRKSSGTTSKPKITYTSRLKGETGTGETQFDARMQLLDRLKAMGKLTDKQELSYLRKWRKEMKLTGDQDYTIRLRIKGLEDKAYEEKKEKEKEEKEAREKAYQKKVEQAKKEKEAKEKAERDKYDAELKYIEKKKNLGQMSAQEEIAEYNYILKHFKLTEDQKTDILVKKHNTEKKLREERYATAKAAYQKLAQDQIDIYNKTNEKIQKDADERIKAIDEETKKHNEKKEDDSRQSEIDKIDFELKYGRGDIQTQSQLRRRRQDLLNEQAEADFQRGQEDKKTNIQNEANAKIAKNTEAVDRLTQAMEKFGNYIDKVSGNQTTTQIINNNSRQQNISILRNSGTDSQLVNKLIKELI